MVFEYQDYRNTPPCPAEHTSVCSVWSLLYLHSAGSLTVLSASCPCCLFPVSHACHSLFIAPINMTGISPPSSRYSCLVSDPTTPQCPLGHVLNWSVPVSLGLLSALPETSYSTSTLLPRSPLKRLLCRVAFSFLFFFNHWPCLVGYFTDCHGSRACTASHQKWCHTVYFQSVLLPLLDSGVLRGRNSVLHLCPKILYLTRGGHSVSDHCVEGHHNILCV